MPVPTGEPRMSNCAIAAAATLALAACDHGYGVHRRHDGPWNFDPRSLQEGLQAMPGRTWCLPWDGRELAFEFQRGAARAMVGFGTDPEAGGLDCGTMWFNTLPDDATLAACIALQDDLLRELAPTVPGFPPAASFRRDWSGFDFPRGEAFHAMRNRYEASQSP